MLGEMDIESITDLLVYPSFCDHFFYLKIMIGLLVILSWTMYKVEKIYFPAAADYYSSLAVVSIGVLILSLIGTLITSSYGIALISSEVLLYILAITIPIIILWIIKD